MTGPIILALAFVSIQNGYETKRAFACMTVLWVTVASISIHESSLYFTLESIFGYYGYLSLTCLASILILSRIKSRLSTCLIVLFLITISVNLVVWLFDGLGHDVEATYERILWCAFVIELALMLSTRVTNVVHGIVHRPKLDRDTAAPILAFEHLDYSSANNSGKDTK